MSGRKHKTCEEMRKLIVGYYFRDLSEEDKKLTENHLKGCKKCRKILMSLEFGSAIAHEIREMERKEIEELITKGILPPWARHCPNKLDTLLEIVREKKLTLNDQVKFLAHLSPWTHDN